MDLGATAGSVFRVQYSIGWSTWPLLGYEACTSVAKEAFKSGRGIKEWVLEKKLLSPQELARFLTLESMVGPQTPCGREQ